MSASRGASLRSGFTVREFCLALALIGVVLALLSVPVQRARVAAWRTADK